MLDCWWDEKEGATVFALLKIMFIEWVLEFEWVGFGINVIFNIVKFNLLGLRSLCFKTGLR